LGITRNADQEFQLRYANRDAGTQWLYWVGRANLVAWKTKQRDW